MAKKRSHTHKQASRRATTGRRVASAAQHAPVTRGARELCVMRTDDGGYIYYSRLLRKSYMFSEQQYRQFQYFSARIPAAISIGALVWGISAGPAVGLATAFGIWLLVALWFYLRFLPGVKTCENDPELVAALGIFSRFRSESPDRIVMRVAISALLCVLVGLNAQQANYASADLVVNYVLICLVGLYGIYQLVGLCLKYFSKR